MEKGEELGEARRELSCVCRQFKVNVVKRRSPVAQRSAAFKLAIVKGSMRI